MELFGTFKSYVTKDRIFIDAPTFAGSCSVHMIVSNCRSFDEVTRFHTKNWREFMPACSQSIVVRPTSGFNVMPGSDNNAMPIVLDIFLPST